MFEPFVEFGTFSQHIRYDASRYRNDTGATIKPAQKVAVFLVVPRLRAGTTAGVIRSLQRTS
jgi:hypothetical protein